MQGLTRYGYEHAISGFFEFPTANARRILPAHLEPVELHHGTSIFSLTAFDFNESMVGSYGEVVMSVIVAPLVKPGERLPKSAFYPYLVGTTTKAARDHAIARAAAWSKWTGKPLYAQPVLTSEVVRASVRTSSRGR